MQLIQKKSLAQEVADHLKAQIAEGFYGLNAKLPTEPELMKQFGVGRSSVREAIKLLANSGYVNVLQGVGTFVASIHGNEQLDIKLEKANFSDLLEVRHLLEVKIAEKAAENRTAKDLEKINQKLNERSQYANEGQIKACIQADIDFHVAIAESCGNELLAELYRTTSESIFKFFYSLYTDTTTFIDTHQLHEQLYLHIKNRNAKKTLDVVNKIIGII